MTEIVIRASRGKLFGQFAAGLVFVAGGWALLTLPSRYGLWAQFVGLVTMAFFGAVSVAVLYRLLHPAPVVIINDEGITDRASGVSVGLIRWDQIDEVKEYRSQGQLFLGIVPKDVEALIAQQPRWKKSIIRANLRMGGAPVNIPQTSIGVKVADLVQETERQRLAGGRESTLAGTARTR